jgi:tetratricopeptide (TPR) repeat protein
MAGLLARRAGTVATMVGALVCAMALPVAPVKAAKTQLPEEQKGDPKPDTDTAAGFLKRGRYEDAIRQAKLALGRDERYVPAMVVLAKAYYFEKKYELATSIVDIAKSIDANNAECYNLLGFIALSRDDKISATAAFKKATDLDSHYGNAWDNLAAQYLYAKNYDGALDAADHATKLLPSFSKAWLNLGSAHRGKLQYAEAEKAYKKAVDLDGNYADAYFNLGILYLDAKEMPGTDLITKENTAINYLNKYKQVAGSRLTRDDAADTYLAEARTAIDREQKRILRQQKQQQRGSPKASPDASDKAAPKAAPAAPDKSGAKDKARKEGAK